MLWELKKKDKNDNCENACSAFHFCFNFDDDNYKKELLKEFSTTCEEESSVFEYLPVELLKEKRF